VPRRPRLDPPDSWHHVVNRGIAKRVLFERRLDVRYFLSRLARQVRAGRIEVHAYTILHSHYHLLLRSPRGELSEAMRQVQNAYTRRFNRLRKRDGSLTRGRFFSRVVDSDEYLRALIRYIDHNPVRAGIALAADDHEHGSASHYISGTRPPWLRRDWIERQACAIIGAPEFTAAVYRRAFDVVDASHEASLVELVEARMAALDRDLNGDRMLQSAIGGAAVWMRWKARLADGVPLGLPLCGVGALRRALDESLTREGVWMIEDGRNTWRGAELAWIGLLHSLCGCPLRSIARMNQCSMERVRRLRAAHVRLLEQQEAYARRTMEVGRSAVVSALRPQRRTPGTFVHEPQPPEPDSVSQLHNKTPGAVCDAFQDDSG
jgi:REP element-mobilizing transposase RayT